MLGDKAMEVVALLHKAIKKSYPFIHSKRLSCLLNAADSLLNNGKLTLTSLGRHLSGKAKVKHKIKKIDRLLGNDKIKNERFDFYKIMSIYAIGSRKEITVIVDWSACGNHNNHILRASLALKHKTVTLYDEVYPEKEQNTYKAHKNFLKNLKKIIQEFKF